MLLMLALTSAFAADTEATWTVQVDPLTAALGYAHVQIEGSLSDHLSLYAGPHLRLYDGILSEAPEPYLGYGIEAGLRWFPWGGAPAGGWALVRGVGALAVTTDGSDERSLAGYVSALGGYTWILADRWVLGLGTGVQYIHYTVIDYGIKGVFPAAHTALGIAF